MLEFFLSALLVFFLPSVTASITLGWGAIMTFIISNLIFLLTLIVLGALSAYISARRQCTTYSAKDSLMRSSITGFITTLCYGLIGYIPVLRVPFGVIGMIPGLAPWVDSFIMSILYVIPNVLVEAAWGAC